MGLVASKDRRSSSNRHFLVKPNTKVVASSAEKPGWLTYSTAAMQGWRATMEDFHVAEMDFMEDASLFAVFDGHAGKDVACFAAENLADYMRKHLATITSTSTKQEVASAIKQAFFDLDATITKRFGKGSVGGTTCTGVVVNSSWYHIFNLGDSRTVLSSDGLIKYATRDHKPSDMAEFYRIQDAGGYVARGRVNGQLAVSRALGDNDYKTNPSLHVRDQMVSCEPVVASIARMSKDEFLLIACDGIWDVMSSSDAVEWLRTQLSTMDGLNKKASIRRSPRSTSSLSSSNSRDSRTKGDRTTMLERTCTKLLSSCLSWGSSDNMSAMIVIPAAVDSRIAPDSSPPPSPTPPPQPRSRTHEQTVEEIAEGTVSCALEMGIATAKSVVNPQRARLQRSLTISDNSPNIPRH